jgi:hypothetical protein
MKLPFTVTDRLCNRTLGHPPLSSMNLTPDLTQVASLLVSGCVFLPTLISDSAGIPSPSCSRQTILSVSERFRFNTSCTRLRLPMKRFQRAHLFLRGRTEDSQLLSVAF